jgi:hypothetical protein
MSNRPKFTKTKKVSAKDKYDTQLKTFKTTINQFQDLRKMIDSKLALADSHVDEIKQDLTDNGVDKETIDRIIGDQSIISDLRSDMEAYNTEFENMREDFEITTGVIGMLTDKQ